MNRICFLCERPDRPIDTDHDWHFRAFASGFRPALAADAVFHEPCFAEFLRDHAHNWYGGYQLMGGRYGELEDEVCYECRGAATARIDTRRLRHAPGDVDRCRRRAGHGHAVPPGLPGVRHGTARGRTWLRRDL